MSADESITSLPEAVAAMGALPVPAVPARSEREELRAAFVVALDNAHQTHPCPVTGRPYWVGCVHYNEAGRVVGVGSCHNERRADAVLVVRDAEVESLRARADEVERRYTFDTAELKRRIAELEAERHSTNEALDDAVQELRRRESGPALPWAHAMSDHDLQGFLNDLVSAALGRWRSEPEVPDRTVLADIEKVCAEWRTPGQGLRLDGSEFDGAVVQLASPQPAEAVSDVAPLFPTVGSLREPVGEFDAFLRHPYRTGHDLPETGGQR